MVRFIWVISTCADPEKLPGGTPDPPPPSRYAHVLHVQLFYWRQQNLQKKFHPGGIPSLGLFDKWKNNLAYQGLPQSTFYQPKELKCTCN